MAEIVDDMELQKTLKLVKIADKFRLIFLIFSLFMVLFVFFGNKFAMNTAWYQAGRSLIYNITVLVIGTMLLSTCVKLYLAVRYNRLLEKKNAASGM